MIKIAIISLILLNLHALSDKQLDRLDIVQEESRKIKINGESYEATIGAKYLVETNAGEDKNNVGDDGKSYGGLQIQVPTVRQIAKWFPGEFGWTNDLSEWDISQLLLKHLEFSAQIATYHLKHYMESGWSYKNSIIIYNGWWQVGKNGKAIRRNGRKVKNIMYYNKVMKAKKLVRRFK